MQLESPYILEFQNADIDEGVPFLVTALATNGSANTPMTPIGAPPDEAIRWVRHTCRGAARTHASGLLHRDIKPHNLFLTASGEAQLGDFGIAVLMDANGEASPGGGNTSVASDVYSLGATLYALLSGKYSNAYGDPPIRDLALHVSQALAQRVHTAIAPDPADRYHTPAEFDAALGDLPAAVRRNWRRTDEHAGHQCCFRGEAPGKADATVCLLAVGTRWEVLAAHRPNGRMITKACRPPGPRSTIARNLRAAMADVP